MTVRNTRKAAAPAAPAAGIVGYDAAQSQTFREGVGAAFGYATALATAKAKGTTAIDMLIAGMANRNLLAHRFEFQARDRKGNVAETKQASLYDYAAKRAPFYLNGKEQRARISGFRAAVLAYAGCNVAPDDAKAKSVWALLTGKALPAALALADAMVAAKIDGGKLALSGGDGTAATAKLLAAAKVSTSNLIGTVKAKGADRRPEETKAETAKAVAKAETLDTEAAMRAAMAYLKKVACGDEAISNKRLSIVKAIAKAAADILKVEAAAA